jgi:TPR repeat protein
MAASQAERETALHDREEALKQRARVARVRNIGVVRLARQMARMLTIIGNVQDRMDFKTKQEVFALVTAEARYGDAPAMQLLGWAYDVGFGVAQDYAKAREWFEKAADKGDARAMHNSARFTDGHGVAQDYAKAREWLEKAADKGDESHDQPRRDLPTRSGVAHDHAKARELYEKVAGKGDAPLRRI